MTNKRNYIKENKNYKVLNSTDTKELIIETIIPDTSAIIEGFLSKTIENNKLKTKKIILHEAIFAELENQANKGRETGFLGLEELINIQRISKEKNITIEYTGNRPNEFEIKQAKSGEIDNLIRAEAKKNNATLITGDIVQSLVAKAKLIPVILLNFDQKIHSKIHDYFDSETMSVHIKENCKPRAKKGRPGNWKFIEINKKTISREEITELIKSIVEEANLKTDSFIEIQRKGSTIVQLQDIRIVITKPPFSEAYEITAVKPIKKLSLNDYKISDKLLERLTNHAEGILISGAPGHGKSTFAQALAEAYASKNKVIKTIEAPRDLILSNSITQYALSHGSSEELHDILLLSRPDYTFFDEMRNISDFKLFADMRLSGVGMIGVVHATKTIDAIQRFIGRIELGIIPHVIDTVIFIKNGEINKVYSIQMEVKVPEGMNDSDLARPVITVRDFESNKTEFEIYTYGDQTTVIPITKQAQDPVEKLALKAIKKAFKKYDSKAIVELNNRVCTVYVSKKKKPALIGKKGENINRLEKDLGVSITVKTLNEYK